MRAFRGCVQDGVGLLAQKAGDPIRAEAALAIDAGAFPAAEGLESGPGAGRGTAAPIGLEHAGLGVGQKIRQLVPARGVDTGRHA